MAEIVINPDIKSLKILPPGFINEFLHKYLSEELKSLNKSYEITKTEYGNSITINTNDIKDSELLLVKLSNKSFSALNKYITSELEDDPKNFYRDLFLFESEAASNRLTLKWK